MGWTKKQFVTSAYEEIGLANYVFVLSPEQMQAAVKRLDSMVAGWNANGIRIGYPIDASPSETTINAQTNVPDSANEAIYLNLAVRIAPMHGKQVSPDLRSSAKIAYNNLLAKNVEVYRMSLGTMPAGAGHKGVMNNFLLPADWNIETGNDGFIEYSGNETLDGEDFS
jgi:hypothetical protein